MPNFERFTVKSAEAIQHAASRAAGGEPGVEDLHLLDALLAQEEGIVVPMLQKVGANVTRLRDELQAALERLPKQYGGSQPTLSRELTDILDGAEKEARELKDEYVSTEHLLLGARREEGVDTRDLLSEQGATRERCYRRWSRCAARTG
jgi:ATP-dependent Clp protease ATP-binding subunit ClpB